MDARYSAITSHHVFVCHSSADKNLAMKILSALERSGVVCWVSFRDIPAGSDWAETIYDAIAHSSVLLLLFTGSANESRQVRNELDIATNLKIPIIPVRLDEAPLSKGVRYFTNSHQWLSDVHRGKRLDVPRLVHSVKTLLNTGLTPDPGHVSRSKRFFSLRKALLSLSVLALASMGTLLLHQEMTSRISDPEGLFSLIAGGTDSWNYASDIVSTGDRGFYAAGTWDWGFWSEVWVARFDSTLSLVWHWSDSLAGECRPRLLLTDDGGVSVGVGEYADLAFKGFSIRALRFNPSGTVLWDNRLRVDWPGSIQPVFGSMEWGPDNTVFMAFTLRVLRNRNLSATHLVRVAEDGGMTWNPLENRMESVAYLPLPDGHAFHVYQDGYTHSTGIELLTPELETLRSIIVGDMRSPATCAVLTPDGGLLVALTGDMYGPGNGDLWLMHFNRDLDLLWKQTYGGDLHDSASRLLVLREGGYLVAGSSRSYGDGTSDGWILRLDEQGELIWQNTMGFGGHDRFLSASAEKEGSFLLCGLTTSPRGEPDAWFMRISSEGFWRDSLHTGVLLFHENWSQGFLDQTTWLIGRNRNYTPALRSDSVSSGFSMDMKGVPLLHRQRYPFRPGLTVSMDVEFPDLPSAGGGNWVCIGITDKPIQSFHLDPEHVPLHQIRWNYTQGNDSHPRQVCALTYLNGTFEEIIDNDSLWVQRHTTQRLAIEVCKRSARYWLNDRLFHEVNLGSIVPESASVYIWGNSVTVPHSIRSVTVSSRRW